MAHEHFPQVPVGGFPPQHQDVQPGIESLMVPRPISENPAYTGSGKLQDKVAIITGGDSGIGRAVAYAFAKEGADVVITYLNEHSDAAETKSRVEQLGRCCLAIAVDIGYEPYCRQIVEETLRHFGRIDILVNNAGVQFPQKSLEDISSEQWELTFRTNLFSFFYLTKAALPHLHRGASIINTASINAYRGHPELIDYSATKGGIVAFTRALSTNLVSRGIRVNGVAPGPIWTPLIVSSFSAEEVTRFGSNVPMRRAGQPFELAPAYVFLASDDSSYMTGQFLHINGGTIING